MKDTVLATLRAHERVIFHAELFPWSALYRIAIGYLVLPIYVGLFGKGDAGWGVVLWFIVVLFCLRLIPAVVRKILPFSHEVRMVWSERRMTAKRFDSYQWKKLLWFGVGLALYMVLSREFDGVGLLLTVFCLLAGALGALVWRRRTATGEVPRVQWPKWD